MDLQNEKCVMILDGELPVGLLANTAAIMGITLGKEMPEVVGANVTDQNGSPHLGIIEFPVPVLKGSPEVMKEIREKLFQPEYQDLTVVDFLISRKAARRMRNSLKRWRVRRKTDYNISALLSAEQRKR